MWQSCCRWPTTSGFEAELSKRFLNLRKEAAREASTAGLNEADLKELLEGD
jgi:hypothetical protein